MLFKIVFLDSKSELVAGNQQWQHLAIFSREILVIAW